MIHNVVSTKKRYRFGNSSSFNLKDNKVRSTPFYQPGKGKGADKELLVAIARRVHLFPFRTEKLSSSALMVLPYGGRVGRRQPIITLALCAPRTRAFLVYSFGLRFRGGMMGPGTRPTEQCPSAKREVNSGDYLPQTQFSVLRSPLIKCFARHFSWLLKTHHLQNSGGNIGKIAVMHTDRLKTLP